jgi:hypothetical protein
MGDEAASEYETTRKETEDDVDVEGHTLVKAAQDEEDSEEPDVEGHSIRKS